MARETDTGLLTSAPTTVVPARLHIVHLQLRDLLVCPKQPGLVNYVDDKQIVEHDIHSSSSPRTLVDLNFTPNTLGSYALPDSDDFLLAAGGQDTELHLSMHSSEPGPSSSSRPPTNDLFTSSSRSDRPPARKSRALWTDTHRHVGISINNSVAFSRPISSLGVGKAAESAAEPMLLVNNNDFSVSFFDVAVRRTDKGPGRIQLRGKVNFNTPINHSSISPDGRTLLSVGDTSTVFLHSLPSALVSPQSLSRIPYLSPSTPLSKLSPKPILTLQMPPAPAKYSASGPPASFATAFSGSGSKFCVGGQDGVLVVWDVRSSVPFKVFDPSRPGSLSDLLREADEEGGTRGNGNGSGWLRDVTTGAFYNSAPPWGVRTIKFGRRRGTEVLLYTEHTSRVHAIDGRTFDTHEVYNMPVAPGPPPPRRRRSLSVDSTSSAGSLDDTAPAAASLGSYDGHRRSTGFLTSGERNNSAQAPPADTPSTSVFAIWPHFPPSVAAATTTNASGNTNNPANPSTVQPQDVVDLIARWRAQRQSSSRRQREIERELEREREDERRRREDPDPGYFIGGAFDRWLNDPPPWEDEDEELMVVPPPLSTLIAGAAPNAGGSVGTGAPGAPRIPYAEAAPVFTDDDPAQAWRPGVFGVRADPLPAFRTDGLQPALARVPTPPSRRSTASVSGMLDLAGCCFSPDGSRVYVASESCVAEWGVRGSERWWEDWGWDEGMLA